MLVNHFLENSAKNFPDKIALVIGERRYSYLELDEKANNLANALIVNGLGKGDRVIIYIDNSYEAVIAIFGVLKAAGIFVMVNPTTKAEKLTYILNNSRAAAIISSWSKSDIVLGASDNTISLRDVYFSGDEKRPRHKPFKKLHSLNEILNSGSSSKPSESAIDIDLANIIYTSGSTGNPKGVMMTHHNMVSAANSITTYLENTVDDIIINTLPMSFDYGLYQVIMAFKMGARVVLEKSFIYPSKVINTIIREKVTGFPIVPTISAILLQMEILKEKKFDHLRYISNTAAALPVAHIKKLKDFFPSTKIYSMYGLTECKRVSYLPPEQIDMRPSSVGVGMPNTEAYVVNGKGERVGPNVVGELVVRGSNVMRGYWEMPEETEKKLRPGPYPGEQILYTGDLFKMDEDGYLYFIGRKDDIIKSRGEKVSPKEIENVIYEIEGVEEVAVVGVPDPVLGEAIKAFIVTSNGVSISEMEVQKFCSKHLEDLMVPKFIEFRGELPKSANGKIKKADLC